jgi:anti-sigma factor RsiW
MSPLHRTLRFSRSRPLTCREVVELVTDYLEGALPRRDVRRVERHLAACEGCSAYLEQMRETIRLTGTLTVEQLDEDVREALLVAFRHWRG